MSESSTPVRPSPRALFRDRRVQIGGTVALSAAALLGAGAIAILASSHADASAPDLADHAQLSIVTAPPPKPVVLLANDKLATLDPEQAAPVQAEPMTPQLQALLAEDRRRDREAAAEQRAFDDRLNGELNDPSSPSGTAQPENAQPAQRGGWTSNTEDAADSTPT